MMVLVYGSEKNEGREGGYVGVWTSAFLLQKGFGKPFHELLELL
jgi:hypothetical protein